ncbi:uncharacterized protein [Macrobrachium rosenbergii]|uniref:uncharacterized protein n=1 Tax=Macrobrachium rosenbergii TaxID=79674 RepID=UPI0034D54DFE
MAAHNMCNTPTSSPHSTLSGIGTLIRNWDEAEPEPWFDHVEEVLTTYQPSTAEVSLILGKHLEGKGTIAFNALPPEDKGNLALVHQAIIKVFEITPNHWSKRWRNMPKESGQTWSAWIFKKTWALKRWLESLKATSVEDVLKHFQVKDFLFYAPPALATHLCDMGPKTVGTVPGIYYSRTYCPTCKVYGLSAQWAKCHNDNKSSTPALALAVTDPTSLGPPAQGPSYVALPRGKCPANQVKAFDDSGTQMSLIREDKVPRGAIINRNRRKLITIEGINHFKMILPTVKLRVMRPHRSEICDLVVARYIPGGYDILLGQTSSPHLSYSNPGGSNPPYHSLGTSKPQMPAFIPLPVPPECNVQWPPPPRSILDPITVPGPTPVPVPGLQCQCQRMPLNSIPEISVQVPSLLPAWLRYQCQ